MNLERFKPYAPLVLRIGLAVVLLFFAYHKLNPLTVGQGRSEIEQLFNLSLKSAAPINYYVGLFEAITGLALLTGWGIRYAAPFAAGLVAAIFGSIILSIGWNTQDTTLIKDIGLVGAGLALWILGAGALGIDTKKGKPTQSYISTEYAPFVIRFTVGVVLLFIGYETWRMGGDAIGLAQLILGAALLIGFLTRHAAFLAVGVFIYIFSTLVIGYQGAENLTVLNDPTRFRDVGIIGALLALVILGAGKWSVDGKLKKSISNTANTSLPTF